MQQRVSQVTSKLSTGYTSYKFKTSLPIKVSTNKTTVEIRIKYKIKPPSFEWAQTLSLFLAIKYSVSLPLGKNKHTPTHPQTHTHQAFELVKLGFLFCNLQA